MQLSSYATIKSTWQNKLQKKETADIKEVLEHSFSNNRSKKKNIPTRNRKVWKPNLAQTKKLTGRRNFFSEICSVFKKQIPTLFSEVWTLLDLPNWTLFQSIFKIKWKKKSSKRNIIYGVFHWFSFRLGGDRHMFI